MYCKADYQNWLGRGFNIFCYASLIYKHNLILIKYFKSLGANQYIYGLDKKPLNYRVKWLYIIKI